MTKELTVITERIDDLPVWIAWQEKLELATLVEQQIAAHGNWHRLSLGQVLSDWLAYILSAADHRLN